MLRRDLALWLPNAFTFLYHCGLLMIVQVLIAGMVSPSWQSSDFFNGSRVLISIFISIYLFSKFSYIINEKSIGGLAFKLDFYSQIKLWLYSNFIIWISVLCVFLSSILINLKNTFIFSNPEKAALHLTESLVRFRTLEINESKKQLFANIDSLTKHVNSPNTIRWVEGVQNNRADNSYVFFRFVTYAEYSKARYLDSLFIVTYNESLDIVNKKSGLIDLVLPRQLPTYSLLNLNKYDNPTRYVLEEAGGFMSEYIEYDSAKYKPISKDSIYYEVPVVGPDIQSFKHIRMYNSEVQMSPYSSLWGVLLISNGILILIIFAFNLNLILSSFIYYKNNIFYQMPMVFSFFIPLLISTVENKIVGLEDENTSSHPALSPYGVSAFYLVHISFATFLLLSKKFNPKNIAHVSFTESLLGIHIMVIVMFLFYERKDYNFLNNFVYYVLPFVSLGVGAMHIYVMKKISIMPKPK